jgi:NADH-quinone oxidoreductase subunit G
LQGSGLVVALTAFKDAQVANADVLLPIAPFTETAGSFINAEGRIQSFQGVVKPLGQTRPAWKVIRVLGNLLGLPGFDQENIDAVRVQALGEEASIQSRLNNLVVQLPANTPISASASALERVTTVPIYAVDSMVRRAPSLLATRDGAAPVVGVPAAVWDQLGLEVGDKVRVQQGSASAILPVKLQEGLPANGIHVPAGHPDTAQLGHIFGAITLEKV